MIGDSPMEKRVMMRVFLEWLLQCAFVKLGIECILVVLMRCMSKVVLVISIKGETNEIVKISPLLLMAHLLHKNSIRCYFVDSFR